MSAGAPRAGKLRLGVCSWSLQPRSPEELAEQVRACGLGHVQLALDPIRSGAWDPRRTRAALGRAGIEVVSGMMAPAGEDYSTIASIRATGGLASAREWPANLEAARANAALSRALGLGLVTLHAGFLPEDPREAGCGVLIERLRALADAFAAQGVALGLETGQESPAALAAALDALDAPGRPRVGVNFDPANMILYGAGEPLAALRRLLPRVLQCHVKDARRSARPRIDWGEEVPVGTGEVDWRGFCALLRGAARPLDLVIEREAGAARVADVRCARAVIERELTELAAAEERN
jgi:sugar phosphate isomerase/epimerase